MMKNQTTLVNQNRREQFARVALVAIIMAFFMSFAIAPGTATVFAAAANDPLEGVMQIVINIVSRAALYIGIVIVLWGVFQIILAFRREDSEGISKQITTVVVGGVLVSFGAIAEDLYNALIV